MFNLHCLLPNLKQGNQLHVQSDIRCALSTTLPDIEKLVAKKQGHPSHYL